MGDSPVMLERSEASLCPERLTFRLFSMLIKASDPASVLSSESVSEGELG